MSDVNGDHVDNNPFESATAALGSLPKSPCVSTTMPVTQNQEYFTPGYENQDNIATDPSTSKDVFFQNIMVGFHYEIRFDYETRNAVFTPCKDVLKVGCAFIPFVKDLGRIERTTHSTVRDH